MPNLFTHRATRRIAQAVRRSEQQRADLRAGRGGGPYNQPFELCRFEMLDALAVPHSGPGTARAYKLHWLDDWEHAEDRNYDYLHTYHSAAYYQRRPIIATYGPTNWYGDYAEILLDGEGSEDDRLEVITVFDFLRRHSKMATTEGDIGAYGIAIKWHDGPVLAGSSREYQHSVWEILAMQTPDSFYGKLEQNLDRNFASVPVSAFRLEGEGHRGIGPGGYNVFGDYHGDQITVYNVPSFNQYGGDPYIHSGNLDDVVFCQWNIRESKYYILWVEPNKYGWDTQTVVTSVDFELETVTTKDIWYPPWAAPV